MNPPKILRLIATLISLAALESHAQPNLSWTTNVFEILPASSPYGAAKAYRNIPYVEHAGPRQNFDLFLPESGGNQPLPLIFWIHGGAWMTGSKEWDNVKYLVKHGYAIASVDYRFTPEFRFPAQIQDCNAALNFILAHAADYGVSSNEFVVGGGSAGGHLALLLGLARQEKDFGADPAVRPLAILDFFGPTDLKDQLEDMQSFSSQKSLQTAHDAGDKLLGGPVENLAEKALWASPISYVATNNPPVLILHGARDDLVPLKESQRLRTALERAGVKNQMIVVKEAGHDGPLFSTPEIQIKVAAFLAGIFQ